MNNKINAIIAKVKEVLFEDPEVKAQWEKMTSIHSVGDLINSAKILFWLVSRIVFVLEYVQKELGQLTKEERIEAAAQLLDDLIAFKGWASVFEPFDFMVFKLVIGQVVSALDSKFGNDWLLNDSAVVELDKYGKLIEAANKLIGNK